MDLSIIIPYYNGTQIISRCLDSIYSQGLSMSVFEVICVDDCSPEQSAIQSIEQYKYLDAHPSNLILIKHQKNKRQGGARNTGIKAAKGEWILFIDQDDFFVSQSLKNVLNAAKIHEQLDFIMFDCISGNETENVLTGVYQGLDESVMPGTEFLQRQPVPWCPWCYLYHRAFLINTGCLFAENVRFEDADFVLRFTAYARKARFLPFKLVYHTEHQNQTSKIGNDKNRILDFFLMNYRVGIVAQEILPQNEMAGKAIIKHVVFMRRSAIVKHLWRIPYKDIIYILKNCQFQIKTGNAVVDFTNRNVRITAIMLSIFAPFFHIVAFFKHVLHK